MLHSTERMVSHIVDITERSEESPQGFFGDQWRQSTYKDRRIVRVGGRELLAIRSN